MITVGQVMKEERDALERKAVGAEGTLHAREGEMEEMAARLRGERDAISASLSSKTEEARELRARLSDLEAGLKGKEEEARELREQVVAARGERDALSATLGGLRGERDALSATLGELRSERDALLQQVAISRPQDHDGEGSGRDGGVDVCRAWGGEVAELSRMKEELNKMMADHKIMRLQHGLQAFGSAPRGGRGRRRGMFGWLLGSCFGLGREGGDPNEVVEVGGDVPTL